MRMRSIPAGAGEPLRSRPSPGSALVYPRWRGGTLPSRYNGVTMYGLSPLARGNPLRPGNRPRRGRSIPAGAGEPAPAATCMVGGRVYPRWRGGTRRRTETADETWGLSPLARGNHGVVPELSCGVGSIPAGAGEPHCTSPSHPGDKVYPRWRGGTASAAGTAVGVPGLSPLARGNRRLLPVRGRRLRSIPAGAGEPEAGGTVMTRFKVYPRWRGGTESPSTV